MEIREGQRSEVEKFQLFDEANAGSEFLVVEHDGRLVGYAQYDGGRDDATIHFMESEIAGGGRAMMEWFQANYEHLVAVSVVETAEGFYAHFGFQRAGDDGYDGFNMEWWAE